MSNKNTMLPTLTIIAVKVKDENFQHRTAEVQNRNFKFTRKHHTSIQIEMDNFAMHQK